MLRDQRLALKSKRSRTWPSQCVRVYQTINGQLNPFDITRTVENVELTEGSPMAVLTGELRNAHGNVTAVWAHNQELPVWFVGPVSVEGWRPVLKTCPACGSPSPELFPQGDNLACEDTWHKTKP